MSDFGENSAFNLGLFPSKPFLTVRYNVLHPQRTGWEKCLSGKSHRKITFPTVAVVSFNSELRLLYKILVNICNNFGTCGAFLGHCVKPQPSITQKASVVLKFLRCHAFFQIRFFLCSRKISCLRLNSISPHPTPSFFKNNFGDF